MIERNGAISVDELLIHIRKFNPDVFLMVHYMNVIADTMRVIRGDLPSTCRVVLYVKCPRKFPSQSLIRDIADLKCVTITSHATHPLGVVARKYIEPTENAKGLMGFQNEKVILCHGRVDSCIMTFAHFLKNGGRGGVQYRMLLSLSKDMERAAYDIIGSEMPDDAGKITFVNDLTFMNHDYLNLTMSAADVIVHANVQCDMNNFVYIGSLLRKPQVVSDNEYHPFGPGIIRVKESFECYVFDKYGGKLGMCHHKDLSLAITECLRGDPSSPESIVDIPSWDTWATILDVDDTSEERELISRLERIRKDRVKPLVPRLALSFA
jgi:hypothetical protein